MKDEQITHETAKLAKDKGFNIGNDNADSYTNEGVITRASNLNYAEICYAPTQTLLQRWLREEHGVNINIRQLNLHNGDVEYNDFIYLKGKNEHEDSTLGNEFDDYEGALENALLVALKSIE